MAARTRNSISSDWSGQLRFRSVTKATTGSTKSSRYFSTTSGVWCCSQVPATDPASASATAGVKSFQSTSPFLMKRAVEKTVPIPAESLLVPRA